MRGLLDFKSINANSTYSKLTLCNIRGHRTNSKGRNRADPTTEPAADISGDWPDQSPGNIMRTLKFPKDDSHEFFRIVRSRAQDYLNDSGQSRYGGWRLLLKGALLGAATVGFYLMALLGGMSVAATLLCAVLFGVSSLLFAMSIGREAAHGTIAPGKLINRVIHFLAFAPLGVNAELWKLRHVKSHHVSPNVHDYDVYSADNGFVRLSPQRNHHWFHQL
jgi:linoleoyl-CoA desaturase